MLMDSSQSSSLNDQRRISTTGAPPPEEAPQPAPVNPTTLVPSAKTFEFLRQVEALAHEVALVGRGDLSDQCIKVQEGPNRAADSGAIAIHVSPHDQLSSYPPSFGRRISLTLTNFFIAARDRLASYRPSFGRSTSLTLANFFIAARDRLASYRPSFGGRTSLILANFFIGALIGVAAAFVWQVSTAKSPNDVAVAVAEKQSDFTPVGQVSLQDAPPQPAPVTQTAPASTAPTTSPELVQQLEGMARDLVVLRRSVEELAAKQEHLVDAQEQLAAKQEQMAQNIAKPQTVKPNIKQKMSSPPRRNASSEPAAQALSLPHPRPPTSVPPDRR